MLVDRVDEVSEHTIVQVEARRCTFATLYSDLARQREGRAGEETSWLGDGLQFWENRLRFDDLLAQMICGVFEVLRGEPASNVEDTQVDAGVFRERNCFADRDAETV